MTLKTFSFTVRRVQEATIIVEVPDGIDTGKYDQELQEFAVNAAEKTSGVQWSTVEDITLENFGEYKEESHDFNARRT